MNVFHTYIHFGLCTTLPDRPSVDQQLKSEDSQNSVSKEQRFHATLLQLEPPGELLNKHLSPSLVPPSPSVKIDSLPSLALHSTIR